MKRFTKKFHMLEAVFAVFVITLFCVLIWNSWNESNLEKAKADEFGVPAVEYNNIRGWAWSENIGWVSFSHFDCDTNGNGLGDAPGCPAVPVPNYGVHALTNSDITGNPFSSTDYNEGALVGHAWSEAVGWISFDRAEVTANGTEGFPGGYDPYPGKKYTARIEQDGTGLVIKGWGRAASGIGESWGGWIKFYDNTKTPPTPPDYKVDIASGVFSGYAWGGETIGWLRFSNPPTYGVTLNVNPPTVSNLSADFADICADNKNPRFNFTYNPLPSGNGVSLKRAYIEIRRADGLNFNDGSTVKILDSGSRSNPPNSSVNIIYGGNDLDRGKNYNWTLKVTDAFGLESVFTNGPVFSVEYNKRPTGIDSAGIQHRDPDFSWSPKLLVPAPVNVYFTSATTTLGVAETICYNFETPRECAEGRDIFTWNIQDANYVGGTSNTSANPTVQFSSSGVNKNVQFSIRAEGSEMAPLTCSTSKNITVSKPIPEFEERRP